MKVFRLSQASVLCAAISLIAFLALPSRAQTLQKTEKESTHEGDMREREEFFYDRLTSGDMKNVAEIRRLGIESMNAMTRPEAFRQEQIPTWKSVGSSVSTYESGRVRSFAFDPNNSKALYIAATVGGLWMTNDVTVPKVTWRCLSDNLPTSVCTAVAIPKTEGNTIYVGTGETYPGYVASVGMGVFKSIDKGLNWTNVLSESVMGLTTAQIAIDPQNADNVFVAAPGDYYALLRGSPGTNGLFHSIDGGATWANAGLPSGVAPLQVSIDPTNALRVYAAGFNGEVYRSMDGGSTWLAASLPYVNGAGKNTVLAVSQSSPNILYVSVATPQSFTSGGLYQSTDYGANWVVVNDGLGSDATDPEMLSHQGFYGHALCIYETDPNSVYMGGLEVYGSLDAGSSFAKYSVWNDYPDLPTYSHADIHALAARDGKLYCGSDGGISIYSNGAWNNKPNNGLPTLQFINVDADENLTRFVGGTQDNGTNLIHSNETVWKTTHGGDGGNTWVSPLDGNIMYGTYTRTRIFRSDDGGINWSDQNFALGGLVTNIDLLNEGALFYAPYDASPDGSTVAFGGGQHVYVTLDGGTDGFAQEGLTTIGTSYSVLISPSNSSKMWAGVKSGIYRSNDRGLTWLRASVTATGNVVGIITGATDQMLYAVIGGAGGASSSHFVKSSDGGVSWKKIATNFPSVPVNSVARSRSGQLFVGTDYGVITSTNDGVTWAPFGVGMPLVQVLSLKVKGTDPEYLLAGTHGRGAYTIQISPLPVGGAKPVTQPATFSLHEISPNPAMKSTTATIGFALAREQDATIELFDALGRTVMTVAHERFSSGEHAIALPLATLSSGEYFVALTSAGATLSKKLVVAK